MPEYYQIKPSTDLQVIGPDFPQCVGLLNDYDDSLTNKKSLYRFAFMKGKRVTTKPDLSAIRIGMKTNKTDFLSCSLGPGNDLVLSAKALKIITQCKCGEMQVFDCRIHQKDKWSKYKWVHFIYSLEEATNYLNSSFYHPDEELNEKLHSVRDYPTFLKFYEELDTFGLIRSERLVLNCPPLDFFVVGRFNQHCYVSASLKQKMLEQNLTGIEFVTTKDIDFKP